MKISDGVRNNPFIPSIISTFLSSHNRPPQEVPQHYHTHAYEWFFCTGGGGIQMVGERQATIKPGQLWLIPPEVSHVFCSWPETGCHCDVLMMRPDYLNTETGESAEEAKSLLHFWKHYTEEHGCRAELPPAAARRAGELFVRIHRVVSDYGYGGATKLRSAMYELLSLAFELHKPPSRNPLEAPVQDEAIQRVLYYLSQHFSNPVTVDELVDYAGLCRSSFYQRFQRATGMSLCPYLNRLRLRAVKEMVAGGMKQDEAALRCGFGSRSNFFQQKKNEEEVSEQS